MYVACNVYNIFSINITSRSAWCLWIKDVVLTVMKIMNFEDTFVSSDDSRWNKHSKSIEIDCSDTLKCLNTIMHSFYCFWTFLIQQTSWVQQ